MLIAGNWKMHLDVAGAEALASAVVEKAKGSGRVKVAVCPPFVHLRAVSRLLKGSRVRLGAQNMYYAAQGAFTGEVSAGMLLSVGCHYVILGHSERRQYFEETDAEVSQKVIRALSVGLVPIICVGETLSEREDGRAREVVAAQVKFALAEVRPATSNAVVIAYEPVWAIGTGRTATPDIAQQMHALIRSLLASQFGQKLAAGIHILYGGSMKPGNAQELLSQPDVDGGLIGGASLKADAFGGIITAAQSV